MNQYNYSARYMDPGLARFTSADPLAEKYYSISLYAYVANNPMRLIDPDGKDWREALKKFRQSVSASVSIGFQVGVELTLNETGVSANVNMASMNLGGILEGENTFNLADPPIRQDVSVEVGKWGFSLNNEIKENNVGLTEKTTEMSGRFMFIEGKIETKETFKKNQDGALTKIGQSETKSDIGVAELSKKIESTIGVSAIIGAEVSISWNKVAEGINEIIKSVTNK